MKLTKSEEVIVDKIKCIIEEKYFFEEQVSKEMLQKLYDDCLEILSTNNFSELEIGFCYDRSKLWIDFNSNLSGNTYPIYLEF
jgi:hypothetical protein